MNQLKFASDPRNSTTDLFDRKRCNKLRLSIFCLDLSFRSREAANASQDQKLGIKKLNWESLVV